MSGQPSLLPPDGEVQDDMLTATYHYYNLYRISFSQTNSSDHEALALVSSKSAEQYTGVLYHVTGLLALGMDYKSQKSRDFRNEKGYSRQTLLGMIKPGDKERLHQICQLTLPPHDDRLLFSNRTKLESQGEKVRDCAVWIDEVVKELIEQGIIEETKTER